MGGDARLKRTRTGTPIRERRCAALMRVDPESVASSAWAHETHPRRRRGRYHGRREDSSPSMRPAINGFRLDSELHQGRSSFVFRGVRLADARPVVVKMLRNEFPTAHESARYEREYAIAGKLELIHGVTVLELLREGHRSVLVYADDGLVSLRWLYGSRPAPLDSLTSIAKGAARALAEIHDQGLMHGDVTPANLLVHPQSCVVKITDFELARSLDGGDRTGRSAGTLSYMAPEQTGRSNLMPDHRSDLYSLGATLFELACGRRVFTDLDDASLVHAHFALPAPSVREFNPAMPPMIDAIIGKLLAKLPAERYQSARGLLADLERFGEQLEQGEPDRVFALGLGDREATRLLDERLIGRTDELAALHAAFAAATASERPLWVHLYGEAGSGKSALVSAFADALPGQNLVLTGSGSVDRGGAPFAPLAAAFDMLLQRWLASSDSGIGSIQELLQHHVGSNIAVLEPMLPRLAQLVGSMSTPLPLGANAEQARFALALRGFLQAAATRQQPLAIFLDDAPAVDAASLEIVERVLASDLSPLLLITAEDSDAAGGDFAEMVERLAAADVHPQQIELGPLTPAAVASLVDGIGEFEGGMATRDALVDLVSTKTRRNPFFTRQFLGDLLRRGLLAADPATSTSLWRLDLPAAQALEAADNVLESLRRGVAALDAPLRRLLLLAACAGVRFDVDTLVAADGCGDRVQLVALLLDLAQQGFVEATGDTGTYRFSHEQLRNAALAGTTDSDRASIHLAIGRQWRHQPARSLFDVLGQLNRGVAAVGEPKELQQVALMNAEAARLARSQAAFAASLEYAGYAISLLPASVADADPDLARELQMLLAEAQAGAGHLDDALIIFRNALTLTETDGQRAHVLERTCDALHSSGQPARALEQVALALAMLGHPLQLPGADDADAQAALAAEFEALFERLANPDAVDLLERLPAADEAAARVSRLFDKAIIGVYFSRPELLGFVTARSVAHVLATGLTPEAALALAWWSMILCMRDRHGLATRYAEFVRRIHERLGNDYYGGGGRMVAAAMTLSWTRPYAEVSEEAGLSARLLHESGNMQFASYGLITQHFISIAEAADCQKILATCETWADYCARYVPLELGQARIRRFCIQTMMGLTPEPLDCEMLVAEYAGQANATDVCESLTEMARLALMRDDFPAALALCERAHPLFVAGAAGNLLLNFTHLVMLAIASARVAADTGSGTEAMEVARIMALHRQAAARIAFLAGLCARNFDASAALVRAESARLDGDLDLAVAGYFAAIRHARSQGYLLLQAQATQYLAETLRRQGHHVVESFDRDANELYRRAGCLMNVRELDFEVTEFDTASHSTRRRSDSTDRGDGIDVLSLIKANDAINAETDFDRLVLQLLAIVVENAGAERGVLVLADDGVLRVAAETASGRLDEPLEQSLLCPVQMVQYVMRTGLAAVLEEGPRRSAFREEPYFEGRRVRSVLAAPLLRQGETRGVVYLENAGVAGAFGHHRLETIGLLLGSAAIALENAALYREQRRYADKLELRVRERTLELERANTVLSRLADVDGLTQVANRRSLDRALHTLAAAGAAVVFVLCDVDDFKAYNDHYGHPAGDEVLRRVAAALAALPLPAGSMVARYGGEEFAVLLPGIEPASGAAFAESIRAAVNSLAIDHARSRAAQHVSLSLGVARRSALAPAQVAELISDADKALYVAKQQGRNRASLHADFLAADRSS